MMRKYNDRKDNRFQYFIYNIFLLKRALFRQNSGITQVHHTLMCCGIEFTRDYA